MSVYASSYYGVNTYGIEPLVEFDASPFIAKSLDYNTIVLSWAMPSGSWTRMLLVRNTFGFPTTPDDGDILVDISDTESNSFGFPYTDSGASILNSSLKLADNQPYYYSLFVYDSSLSKWYRAGNALALSVKDYGTTDMMYDYVPLPYKVIDESDPLSVAAQRNLQLYRFLKVFAFEYDYFKAMAENAKNRYDIAKLDGRMIPVMMDQYGLTFESEMGIAQGRRLLQNISSIYLTKGSRLGLRAFVSAFTGFNCSVTGIKNLFLDLDGSSFEAGVGNWNATTNCTISSITGSGESPALVPYEETTSPSGYPNAQNGLLKWSVTSTGTSSITYGSANAKTLGIPVTEGDIYTFSVHGRSKSAAKAVTPAIAWYTRDGVLISTTTAASATNTTTSSWTRITVANATAPTNAVFALPKISIASDSSGAIHYFDAAQFEEASSATDYVDARRVDITLLPNRINYIKNPSFDANTTGWSTRNGTVASSSSGVAANFGSAKALFTVGSSGQTAGISISPSSTYMPPVVPGQQYTFSIYVRDVDTAKSYKAYIDWYNATPTYMTGVAGATTTITDSGWTRVTVTATAPANAAYARPYVYSSSTFSAGDSGKQVMFDGALFEPGDSVNQYFDGGTGYNLTTDLLWKGNSTNADYSLYYKNRLNVYTRLKSVLNDYMIAGTTWALFFQ